MALWGTAGTAFVAAGTLAPPLSEVCIGVFAFAALSAIYFTRGRGAAIGVPTGVAVGVASLALLVYIGDHGLTTPVALLLGCLAIAVAVGTSAKVRRASARAES